MASQSSAQLLAVIDDALYNPTPDLPYTDPTQKSTIRAHLLDTFHTFSSLNLSVDSYTSPTGAVTPVFKLSVNLSSPPEASVTVWVPQDYPLGPPMVLASTGTTSTPYLRAWRHPGSTLLGLLRSLRDQLAALHRARTEIESSLRATVDCHVAYVDALVDLQAGLRSRGESIDCMMSGLEHVVLSLERQIRDTRSRADDLTNWLRTVRHVNEAGLDLHEAFEAVDEESRSLMECLADDKAVEDAMHALDKAVAEGIVGFEVYMKQVRVLAREQFLVRAKLVKFKGPDVLCHLD